MDFLNEVLIWTTSEFEVIFKVNTSIVHTLIGIGGNHTATSRKAADPPRPNLV